MATAVPTTLSQPNTVERISPAISPMEQPVRQWRVALAAMEDMS